MTNIRLKKVAEEYKKTEQQLQIAQGPKKVLLEAQLAYLKELLKRGETWYVNEEEKTRN